MDSCDTIVDDFIQEYKYKHIVEQSTIFSAAGLGIAILFALMCAVEPLRTQLPPLAYKVNVVFGMQHLMARCQARNNICDTYRWTQVSKIIILIVVILCIVSYILVYPVINTYAQKSATLLWTSGAKLAQAGKVACYQSVYDKDSYWVETPGGLLGRSTYSRLDIPPACALRIKAKYDRINRKFTTPLGCILAAALLVFFVHFGAGPLWPGVRGAYCGRRRGVCKVSTAKALRWRRTRLWRLWNAHTGTISVFLNLAGTGALAASIYLAHQKVESGNNKTLKDLGLALFLIVLAALLLGAGLWRLGWHRTAGIVTGIILIVIGILIETQKLVRGMDAGDGVLGAVFVLGGVVAMQQGAM